LAVVCKVAGMVSDGLNIVATHLVMPAAATDLHIQACKQVVEETLVWQILFPLNPYLAPYIPGLFVARGWRSVQARVRAGGCQAVKWLEVRRPWQLHP